MVRSLLLVTAAVLVVLAGGCASPVTVSPDKPAPAPLGADSPVITPGIGTSPVATPAAGTAAGLPPDVADRAIGWLAGEANVSEEALRLVAAEQVQWTDSCFGLGGPAESCLQAITPGWRITFEAAGRQYEVRSDESGSAFRLAPQGS